MLRNQIKGRIRLNDGERKALADIGQKLGRQALKEVATIVKPDTILGWHRMLVAQEFDHIPPNSYEMSMPTWSAPAPHEMGCPRPQLPV